MTRINLLELGKSLNRRTTILNEIAHKYIRVKPDHRHPPVPTAFCICATDTGLEGLGTIPFKRLMELWDPIISTLLSETNTNDTLSPALRRINLRTSAGIVTCPLTDIAEVMVFSFANGSMITFPYREVKRKTNSSFAILRHPP